MRKIVEWLLDNKFQFDVRDNLSEDEFKIITWNVSGKEFLIEDPEFNLDVLWE